ncbi:MAG: L-glutamate gamma-semialdehyde dehydrogenase [Oligoflexia bacterium]|nr:L-glutamate gamma-semialdehyde dehydrogenase [Oligoflexia bacterium]
MSLFSIIDNISAENEPVKQYAPGSDERKKVKDELQRQLKQQVEIPVIIGGKEYKTASTTDILAPHDLKTRLGAFHNSTPETINEAVEAATEAAVKWSKTEWEERAAIFYKAAELLSGKYRDIINAATMLGQSKNVMQAEIDSACEIIDFWRFNVSFLVEIYRQQPPVNPKGTWNKLEYRPLEGFVFAISPFNFTSIAANLSCSPVLMGNVCIWKPASTAVLSAYYLMKLYKEAGLPDGVINMIPGRGAEVGDLVFERMELAGIHFTGSTPTFNRIWKKIGENLNRNLYRKYPRVVGETGGKGFVFAFNDVDIDELCTALVRGAFEYQGQKCSAASRAYIPKSIARKVTDRLGDMISKISVGDVLDFRNFMNAVIDKKAYGKIVSHIEEARQSKDADILIGGTYSDDKGYFIHPTVIEARNPVYKSMVEEIFGPVLTVYFYDDDYEENALKLVDKSTPYALTGAVFSKDREKIGRASRILINSAGNFYINDKPTGAVVGQQPFGGSRGSGTNDKAGSYLNLLRWVSPRTVKENFNPPADFTYPFMLES